MGSVLRGISGLWWASLMSGAMFVLAALLGAPGEPPAAALTAQFCPLPEPSTLFRSSIVFPAPSAAVSQIQPLCPRLNGPRTRVAQSPSFA